MKTYREKIEKILRDHPHYPVEAYEFVVSAIDKTVAQFPAARHISGQELLEGIRTIGLKEFGPMARSVFNHWGIHETLHFGEIVFALVDAGILRKQPDDKLEDFKDIYAFEDAFDKGYAIPEAEE